MPKSSKQRNALIRGRVAAMMRAHVGGSKGPRTVRDALQARAAHESGAVVVAATMMRGYPCPYPVRCATYPCC